VPGAAAPLLPRPPGGTGVGHGRVTVTRPGTTPPRPGPLRPAAPPTGPPQTFLRGPAFQGFQVHVASRQEPVLPCSLPDNPGAEGPHGLPVGHLLEGTSLVGGPRPPPDTAGPRGAYRHGPPPVPTQHLPDVHGHPPLDHPKIAVRLLGTPAPSAKGLSAARSYCTRRAGPVRYNGKAGGVHRTG